VELRGLLGKVIERSGLAVVLKYDQSPVPPLDHEDEAWLGELLNR